MGQAEVSPALARLAVGAITRPYVGHILDLPRTEETMFRQKTKHGTKRALGMAISVVMLGAVLASCSDLYYDRRETVALSSGDAVAANAIEQMIDPWPPRSGDKNIAFNGQKMQSAVERYRTDVVTPPIDPMMLQTANQSPATAPTAGSQTSPPSSQSSSTAGGSAPGGNSGQ